MPKRLSLKDIRRIALKHNSRIVSDGVGGYEILAPPNRRWIDAEVQCYVLAMNEYESEEEKQDEIQRCIDLIENGHEPYPD